MHRKNYVLIICTLLLALTSFSQEDNEELKEIYNADQADRSSMNADWSVVAANDSKRRTRVLEMLDSNLVVTSNDYANAAMVFQHGDDSTAYRMVITLMEKAIELDPNRSKWLLAAGIDRELMSRDKPQIYGTQFRKYTQDDGTWGDWVLYEMDTTVISDEERMEYGVPPLSQLKVQMKQMNVPALEDYENDGMTVKEIIKLCKEEKKKGEEVSLASENSLNNYGYFLMGNNRDKDALKIFKLNTKFYPQAFNPFDSLGECYLKMGKEKKGIKAYKKSLELNSENQGARAIINEYEKK